MRFLPGSCRVPSLVLIALFAAMLLPAAASALELQIVNESGREPEDVYVTVAGEAGTFDVPGMVNDEPKKLSEIPEGKLTIEKLISGRVYIAYGAGVTLSVPFDSPTRFDWAELTVTPVAADVANLTAVDQFGIGMRLDTYDEAEEHLEALSAANSDAVFAAMQGIPGGVEATVRDGGDNVIRVLSPLHTSAYPDLGEYVRSLSGKTVTLHTAFFGKPFTTSQYSGTFGPDGTITLAGASNPAEAAPASFTVQGEELIEDIYTGAHTPNDLEGTIRRDLLAGFSTGLWGGRYGNDALSFCSDPMSTEQGSWCPKGFNQPAFGDARLELSPFPTCEQYAAVINQYSDSYGNPYSDASKRVTVGLDQPVSGGAVKTLKLTILPDSGNSQPQAGGNPNCGAAAPAPAARTKVRLHLRRRARAGKRIVKIGVVGCSAACGRVWAVAKHGRRVLGHRFFETPARKRGLALKLTRPGKRLLARHRRLKARVDVWVTPPGQAKRHLHRRIVLLAR